MEPDSLLEALKLDLPLGESPAEPPSADAQAWMLDDLQYAYRQAPFGPPGQHQHYTPPGRSRVDGPASNT